MPQALLALSADERRFNAEHPDGPTIKLWPISGFVADGVDIIYYHKVLFRDYFDFTVMGTGVAHLTVGDYPAARLAPGRYARDKTLLWLNPQHDWGSGAFLAPDGFAYIYGCVRYGVFERGCRIARVRPSQAAEPDAYEYRSLDGWSDQVEDAEIVLWGPSAPSTQYNPHLQRYIVVYSEALSNEVVARTSSTPWGPFSDAEVLFIGEAPARFSISGVQQHGAFEKDGGRALSLSYFTEPDGGVAGMRLLRVVLSQ